MLFNKKKAEEPRREPVLLTSKHAVLAGMLEDTLKQNGIPCVVTRDPALITASYIGSYTGNMLVYVAPDDLPRAQEICDELFSQSENE